MDPEIVVGAWVVGLFAGAAIFEGICEMATGRLLLNPRRINWSVGEARVSGLVTAIQGLVMASGALAFGLMGGAVLVSALWFIWFIGLVLLAPISQGLLEQHRNRRWPFKPPASKTPPVEPA
jgi:hypothetical protein